MIEIKSHNKKYHIEILTNAARMSSAIKPYIKTMSQVVFTNKDTVLLKNAKGQYITTLSLDVVLKEYNKLMSEV